MGRPIKKTESSTSDTGYAAGIGGTIGKPFAINGVYTIDFQYADAGGLIHARGHALKQRGKARFDVSNSNTFVSNATVTLVNTAWTDGNIANLTLAANTAIVSCYGNATYQFYAKQITSKHVTDWNGNKYVYAIRRAADATYGNVATN